VIGRRARQPGRRRRVLSTDQSLRDVLPLPPLEMRELVGTTEPEMFDQPEGEPVFAQATREQYASVLDFGCGCGRVARKLALANAPMPSRYLGIDLHRGMVHWNNDNLAPWLPNFAFQHHDVFNAGFNPGFDKPRTAPLPTATDSVTLVVAWSVFTHLVQSQAEHYLDEVARVLAQGGLMIATWFLFEKAYFPMMQDFQHALYINDADATNAVIYDRDWLLRSLDERGLRVRAARPPEIRGYHWVTEIEPGRGSIALPVDEAPFGRLPPPVGRPNASRLGFDALPSQP
jgi:SAM-dependent methyltransferase